MGELPALGFESLNALRALKTPKCVRKFSGFSFFQRFNVSTGGKTVHEWDREYTNFPMRMVLSAGWGSGDRSALGRSG